MGEKYRRRRIIFMSLILILLTCVTLLNTPEVNKTKDTKQQQDTTVSQQNQAINELEKIPIKGRSPKTGYSRDHFGSGWSSENGCDTRNVILNRDLRNALVDSNCKVTKGLLEDPYSGKVISFSKSAATSGEVQIDHVVALSDAWQKGAQQLDYETRVNFANDPLELLAVSRTTNEQKGDGDAATWLPPNKAFRCAYVARQVAIKRKYKLWVTQAEHDAIKGILGKCQGQLLPTR